MSFSTYTEVLDFLYKNLPMFQRVGAVAFKKDLTNTIALCDRLGNPQHSFTSIHVAGTNGKGSTSHMLAAILQCAGFKTGLYTSPHLKEFTERIRVDGREIRKEFVVDFVNRIEPAIHEIQPSFFEITVAMAFDYFAAEQVDVAVIEVGLGGRLDSTNVITPAVSVITGIGWDHKDLLGDTLEKIAFEKAGIIKEGVPVVISQRQASIDNVFLQRAQALHSDLYFADEFFSAHVSDDRLAVSKKNKTIEFEVEDFPLKGLYQEYNVPGVLKTIDLLRVQGWKINDAAVVEGLRGVTSLTGLKGRWQQIGKAPLIICDTGHNVDGIREVVRMIHRQVFDRLYMVIGMVKDKDVSEVLQLLPREGYYFFCQASIPRAMDANQLATLAGNAGLQGEVVPVVNEAIRAAKSRAGQNDFIFVGGSTFVVAEVDGI